MHYESVPYEILAPTGAGRREGALPQPLFEVDFAPTWRQLFAVSADGQRFLIHTAGRLVNPPITVVLNWTAKFGK